MPAFDPYHQWLGIPPQEQPATHYRLLGIEPFEADEEVISSAADRQMAHVRKFQMGPHGAVSQRILCELSTARLILLHPVRKAGYDTVLRSAVPMTRLEEEPKTAAPPAKAAKASSQSPAASEATAGDFPPGTVISEYRIVEPAGGSAFGKIYKAQHVETGRYFFVKVLPAAAARNGEVKKRFERECKILMKLDHPNLIVGRESGEHAGQKYLVMDYVLGTDLATVVKEQGPLPVDQGVDYVVQVTHGLTQLHLNGVYHRNIKPHVLLVDLQGNLRITNLFLAKIGESSSLEGEALTTMGEQMGSLDYLPPEQALDARQADARSDIYSLGCTLFHLLTGQPPYLVKSAMEKILAHKNAPVPSMRKLRPEIPESLDQTLAKMLAKQPESRFQFTGDLIAALEKPSQKSWWQQLLAKLGLGAK